MMDYKKKTKIKNHHWYSCHHWGKTAIACCLSRCQVSKTIETMDKVKPSSFILLVFNTCISF